MPVIKYDNQQLSINNDETVLEGLLREGHEIANACRAGACQSCKLKASAGSPPPQSQQGLSKAEKELGYFLSCICKPTNDMEITQGDSAEKTSSRVLLHEKFSDNVLRLQLEATFDFKAGQFFNIWLDDNTTRSYSIASTPEEGVIECHIKHIENGKFSPYAFEQLNVGDQLTLQGPMGTCIYSASSTEQPMLLAGIGTGLAPLVGILKDALQNKHTGPIHLIAGAKHSQDIYLIDELNSLAKAHKHVSVDFICQEQPSALVEQANIYEFVKAKHPNTKGYSVYLCGAQSFVNKLKKQCFLAGANMPDIHADAFVACA